MYENEKKFEVIENIPEWNLKIIQNNKHFKFGVDSVCLAKFASNANTKANILDLCSGTGAIGLIYFRLIEKKLNENPKYTKIENITFVEKQDYLAYLNKLNIENNCIPNARVLTNDIIKDNLKKHIIPESIDIILCNPPYYLNKHDKLGIIKEKEIAKFEEKDFLNSLFKTSYELLKDNGELFIVHKPERLPDLFITAEKYNMTPKVLQFAQSKNAKKPALVLLAFRKNAKKFLKILDNYIIL